MCYFIYFVIVSIEDSIVDLCISRNSDEIVISSYSVQARDMLLCNT